MDKRSPSSPTQRGFTLMEVLVASLILFSAIAISTMAYRTAIGHLNQISQRTRTASTFYMVRDLVHEELAQGRTQGEGEWSKDFGYAWKSEILQSGKNVVGSRMFGEGADMGSFKMILLRVTLDLWEKDTPFRTSRSFEYKELIFSKTG